MGVSRGSASACDTNPVMFEPLARGDCRRRRGARDRCPLPPGKQSIWACDAVVEPDRITHALSGDRPSMITSGPPRAWATSVTVSYTHLRAHETVLDLVCR